MARYPWPTNCHPVLVERVASVCQEFAIPGVREARPYFGARHGQEQAALYAQGREPLHVVNQLREEASMGPLAAQANEHTVTDAKPGESLHTLTQDRPLAKAADVVIVNLKTGKLEWWDGTDLDADGICDYEELGLIAEKAGLKWGGRFRKPDWGHLELKEE